MQSAEASTPAPTYGTPASSSSPCTVPSSPNGPCRTGKTTSTSASAAATAARRADASASRRRARRAREPQLAGRALVAELPAPAPVDLDRARPRCQLAARAPRRRSRPTRARSRARSSGRRGGRRSGGAAGSRGRRRGRRRRRSSCVVAVRSSSAGRSVGDGSDPASPTVSVTTSSPCARRPAGRVLREHDAVLARVGDVLRHRRSTLKPAPRSSASRRPASGPSRPGTCDVAGPFETESVTFAPFGTLRARGRILRRRPALRLVGLDVDARRP